MSKIRTQARLPLLAPKANALDHSAIMPIKFYDIYYLYMKIGLWSISVASISYYSWSTPPYCRSHDCMVVWMFFRFLVLTLLYLSMCRSTQGN